MTTSFLLLLFKDFYFYRVPGKILLTLFLIFVNVISFAQSVSGIVRNEAGEPLALATVSALGSNFSTTTNFNGQYKLSLTPGKYTLQFRFLGYEELDKEVEFIGHPLVLDVVMKQKEINLNEVTISADARDPAYAIMAKVVENKHKYLTQPSSFKCNTYLRLSLERELREGKTWKKDSIDPDKMLHFVESYGTTWFEQPNQIKEVKEAYKDRSEGNTESFRVGSYWDDRKRSSEAAVYNPYLFYVSVSEADFNLYQSFVNIPKLGPVPYVSPVSGTATISYKFRHTRTYFEDDQQLHEIEIIPRNKEGALYKGSITIVDGDWAIKKFDLKINDGSVFFFDHFQLSREYEKVGDIYVTTREEFHYTTTEGKFLMKGHTLVNYSNYELNPVIPKNFFKNELRITLDDAYDKDTTYWNNIRLEPLGSREAEFVNKLDSLITYHRSESYLKQQDSIYNRVKPLDFLLFGVGFHNSFKKRTLFFEPLVSSLQPFGVDGIRFSLSGYYNKEFSRANEISLNGRADYGFANNDIKGYGRLRYLYNPKQLARAYISYGNVYSRVTPHESIAGMLSKGNFVLKKFYGFGHEHEVRNGLMLKAGAQFAQRTSIDTFNLDGWWDELFGNEVEPKSFEPYNEWLLDFELEFTPHQQYYTEPYKKVIIGSTWPTFTLKYKKAVPDVMGATINYDFVELTIIHEIKAGAFGTSRWGLSSGVFLNKKRVELTDEKFFRGSDRYFFSNPLITFQLLGPTISTTNEFLQVNYLHNFEHTLLNKVPLVRLLGLYTAVGGGALFIKDNNFRHVEVWAGLEKPFRIKKQYIKIGVYGVTSDDNVSTLDGSIKFGIDFFNAFTGKWSY